MIFYASLSPVRPPEANDLVLWERPWVIGTYAFRPRFMPSLACELTAKINKILLTAPQDGSHTAPLCIVGGDTIYRADHRLTNISEVALGTESSPTGEPLFTLSESVESVPKEIRECVAVLVDTDSDSGNDWLEPKVGLVSEVRTAVDEFARRVARLAGRRLVAP